MGETQIVSEIRKHLKILEELGLLVYIRNNTGVFKKGPSFVRVGKEGSPDFLIFCQNGATIHLEVKKNDTKQNENQIIYQKRIEKLGHNYKVVRSWSETKNILNNFL